MITKFKDKLRFWWLLHIFFHNASFILCSNDHLSVMLMQHWCVKTPHHNLAQFPNGQDLMLMWLFLFLVHYDRFCYNSFFNKAYSIHCFSWIFHHHRKAVKNTTPNGSECNHIGIKKDKKKKATNKTKTCILKFDLWLRLLRVQKNELYWLGLWRLVSLSINRRAFPTGRGAPGKHSFSVIRAWTTLTVLVCWGSACWSRCWFGFLLKVCDYYC